MKKGKILRTLAVAGACLCAPLVLSGCMKENSSKVDFRVKDGYIQVTEDGKNWKNLIDIDDLKGEQGLPGENGVGVDGKEVEFQVADGWIQWKYTIDTKWTKLIELEELKGEDADAPTIEIGENGNWFIDGVDLGVKAEAVNGETGNGIQNVSIDPNKSDASKTTYVITFTDGTTFEFEVQNGQNGENVEAEEYTITYDYGVASGFFQTAPNSETIKSTQWLTTLPSIKSDYIECFKGWFIKGTEKQIENYDFIGGDVTLEARFYIKESSPAGLYKNGKMTETWQQLIDSEYITVNETTITDCSDYYIRGELVISNSIDTIGENAFTGCHFTEVVIPNGVTSIGGYAFAFCLELTEITISSSVTSIGNNVFYSCTALTSITVDSRNSVYRSEGNCIIRKLDNTLIVGCKNSVIPNSVTSIGDEAFRECTGLTEITIPNSVTSIGFFAFSYCSELTEITIPSSVTSISDRAFYSCTGLESITVDSGNGVYRSESNCLIEGNELILGCKNSTIPNSVTSIRGYAFEGCTGLTEITISNSVTTIGYFAFSYCSELTEITIPSSVTSIGGYAFKGCTGLESITVDSGNSVYRSESNCLIKGNELILGCKNSTIPNSVTSIGDGAFEGCTGLTTITIPNTVTSIGGGAFDGCTGLTEITIPNTVTSIGNYVFYYCTGLTEIHIPNSVTSIGDNAFYHCRGLTEITIPSSVTTIGEWAFYECYNIKTVVIDSATIANNLTDVAYYNNGALLSGVTTVYIKSGLDVSGSTYLASHFTKQSTSDMVDYDKYVLKAN